MSNTKRKVSQEKQSREHEIAIEFLTLKKIEILNHLNDADVPPNSCPRIKSSTSFCMTCFD